MATQYHHVDDHKAFILPEVPGFKAGRVRKQTKAKPTKLSTYNGEGPLRLRTELAEHSRSTVFLNEGENSSTLHVQPSYDDDDELEEFDFLDGLTGEASSSSSGTTTTTVGAESASWHSHSQALLAGGGAGGKLQPAGSWAASSPGGSRPPAVFQGRATFATSTAAAGSAAPTSAFAETCSTSKSSWAGANAALLDQFGDFSFHQEQNSDHWFRSPEEKVLHATRGKFQLHKKEVSLRRRRIDDKIRGLQAGRRKNKAAAQAAGGSLSVSPMKKAADHQLHETWAAGWSVQNKAPQDDLMNAWASASTGSFEIEMDQLHQQNYDHEHDVVAAAETTTAGLDVMVPTPTFGAGSASLGRRHLAEPTTLFPEAAATDDEHAFPELRGELVELPSHFEHGAYEEHVAIAENGRVHHTKASAVPKHSPGVSVHQHEQQFFNDDYGSFLNRPDHQHEKRKRTTYCSGFQMPAVRGVNFGEHGTVGMNPQPNVQPGGNLMFQLDPLVGEHAQTQSWSPVKLRKGASTTRNFYGAAGGAGQRARRRQMHARQLEEVEEIGGRLELSLRRSFYQTHGGNFSDGEFEPQRTQYHFGLSKKHKAMLGKKKKQMKTLGGFGASYTNNHSPIGGSTFLAGGPQESVEILHHSRSVDFGDLRGPNLGGNWERLAPETLAPEGDDSDFVREDGVVGSSNRDGLSHLPRQRKNAPGGAGASRVHLPNIFEAPGAENEEPASGAAEDGGADSDTETKGTKERDCVPPWARARIELERPDGAPIGSMWANGSMACDDDGSGDGGSATATGGQSGPSGRRGRSVAARSMGTRRSRHSSNSKDRTDAFDELAHSISISTQERSEQSAGGFPPSSTSGGGNIKITISGGERGSSFPREKDAGGRGLGGVHLPDISPRWSPADDQQGGHPRAVGKYKRGSGLPHAAMKPMEFSVPGAADHEQLKMKIDHGGFLHQNSIAGVQSPSVMLFPGVNNGDGFMDETTPGDALLGGKGRTGVMGRSPPKNSSMRVLYPEMLQKHKAAERASGLQFSAAGTCPAGMRGSKRDASADSAGDVFDTGAAADIREVSGMIAKAKHGIDAVAPPVDLLIAGRSAASPATVGGQSASALYNTKEASAVPSGATEEKVATPRERQQLIASILSNAQMSSSSSPPVVIQSAASLAGREQLARRERDRDRDAVAHAERDLPEHKTAEASNILCAFSEVSKSKELEAVNKKGQRVDDDQALQKGRNAAGATNSSEASRNTTASTATWTAITDFAMRSATSHNQSPLEEDRSPRGNANGSRALDPIGQAKPALPHPGDAGVEKVRESSGGPEEQPSPAVHADEGAEPQSPVPVISITAPMIDTAEAEEQQEQPSLQGGRLNNSESLSPEQRARLHSSHMRERGWNRTLQRTDVVANEAVFPDAGKKGNPEMSSCSSAGVQDAATVSDTSASAVRPPAVAVFPPENAGAFPEKNDSKSSLFPAFTGSRRPSLTNASVTVPAGTTAVSSKDASPVDGGAHSAATSSSARAFDDAAEQPQQDHAAPVTSSKPQVLSKQLLSLPIEMNQVQVHNNSLSRRNSVAGNGEESSRSARVSNAGDNTARRVSVIQIGDAEVESRHLVSSSCTGTPPPEGESGSLRGSARVPRRRSSLGAGSVQRGETEGAEGPDLKHTVDAAAAAVGNLLKLIVQDAAEGVGANSATDSEQSSGGSSSSSSSSGAEQRSTSSKQGASTTAQQAPSRSVSPDKRARNVARPSQHYAVPVDHEEEMPKTRLGKKEYIEAEVAQIELQHERAKRNAQRGEKVVMLGPERAKVKMMRTMATFLGEFDAKIKAGKQKDSTPLGAMRYYLTYKFKTLKKAFQFFDFNCNGSLAFIELSSGLNMMLPKIWPEVDTFQFLFGATADEVYHMIDDDDSGSVDLKEFMGTTQKQKERLANLGRNGKPKNSSGGGKGGGNGELGGAGDCLDGGDVLDGEDGFEGARGGARRSSSGAGGEFGNGDGGASGENSRNGTAGRGGRSNGTRGSTRNSSRKGGNLGSNGEELYDEEDGYQVLRSRRSDSLGGEDGAGGSTTENEEEGAVMRASSLVRNIGDNAFAYVKGWTGTADPLKTKGEARRRFLEKLGSEGNPVPDGWYLDENGNWVNRDTGETLSDEEFRNRFGDFDRLGFGFSNDGSYAPGIGQTGQDFGPGADDSKLTADEIADGMLQRVFVAACQGQRTRTGEAVMIRRIFPEFLDELDVCDLNASQLNKIFDQQIVLQSQWTYATMSVAIREGLTYEFFKLALHEITRIGRVSFGDFVNAIS
eukprot:CAMPEP_0178999808 /NCGR_PEP_ID=MMETSP0795-20121207/10297_1 /TAXON_ID=88552 /ORGANISM="Amoebophrya sp., Strain Ameob2" /LENGTH=2279 /DNA_ID=CAMNT_0020692685 /DNA_START=282 /DNA_END=7122 /DNA_ORIENTATION=-